MASTSDVGAGEDLEWHRPHPITILVEIGTAFRSFIFAIVIVIFGGGGGFLGVNAIAEFLVVLTPMVGGLARWYTTRYALGPESVHLRQGLVRRRKQVLPRSNVQNVSTKAGIVSRLASVVELQISDASSSGDIKLRLIAQDEAERLTTLLRSSMADADEAKQAATWAIAPTPPGPPVPGVPDPDWLEVHRSGPNELAPNELAPNQQAATDGAAEFIAPDDQPVGPPVKRPPLVQPSIRTLLIAEATSMSSMAALIAALLVAVVSAVAVPRLSLIILPNLGTAAKVAVLAAVPVLSRVMTVASRLPVLGGFELHADPDRLRIQAGLLTETKVAARRERIQQIGVFRDLPHQWLGLERVLYETADVDLQTTTATRYLDPAGSTGGWKALAAEAIGGTALDEADLGPVSRITIRRAAIRLAPLAVGPGALGAALNPYLGGLAALCWLVVVWWYARRRFAVLGWAADDTHYLLRSGVFYTHMNLVRLDKIQSLRVTSTFLQRRLGLATLSLSTAGVGLFGLVSLPDLPLATAEGLMTSLATRSALTPIEETL